METVFAYVSLSLCVPHAFTGGWMYSTAHFVVTDWPYQIRLHCTGYVFPRNTSEIRHTLVQIMRAALIVTPECWQNLLSDATHSQIKNDRPSHHHSHISASHRAQMGRNSGYDMAFCFIQIHFHTILEGVIHAKMKILVLFLTL